MVESFHILESLPAYALGSLDEEEARLVAEHLAGCHLCRTELGAFQRVADQLSLAIPEALPSTELKPRLMERIQGLNMKRQPQSSDRRFPVRLLPIGASVGLLLIVVLAVSNILLWQKINHPEFLTGPLGMRAIALQNSGAAPDASGFVVIGADGKNGVLVVDQLPSLDANHEYQAWLERDGKSISGAVFSVDEDGYRGVRITALESLLVYSEISVTIEPAGGSDDPTGERVLSGSLFNP
jgi:anti-sigma-K factor RskA